MVYCHNHWWAMELHQRWFYINRFLSTIFDRLQTNSGLNSAFWTISKTQLSIIRKQKIQITWFLKVLALLGVYLLFSRYNSKLSLILSFSVVVIILVILRRLSKKFVICSRSPYRSVLLKMKMMIIISQTKISIKLLKMPVDVKVVNSPINYGTYWKVFETMTNLIYFFQFIQKWK